MGLVNRIKFYWVIAQILSGQYQATTIVFVDFGLTDADLDLLLWALDRSPQVKAKIELIDLSNTKVKDPQNPSQCVNTLTRATFKDFPALKTLKLDRNKLRTLSLERTPYLQKLSVKINELKKIDGLVYLTLLQNLDIFGNSFEKINLSNQEFLRLFDAEYNKFKIIDISNKPYLEHAYLKNNPLQTLLFANTLLSNVDYDSKKFDAATKLTIQQYGANTVAVNAITPAYNVVVLNPNIQLSGNQLNAHFHTVFRQKAAQLNKLLAASREVYLSLMTIDGIESMVVMNIVFDEFRYAVIKLLKDQLSGLKSQADSANQHASENDALIDGFLKEELSIIMKPKFSKARQLFFSPVVERVAQRRNDEKIKKRLTIKG